MSGDGGGHCGAAAALEGGFACSEPVAGALDSGIVQLAGADAGVAYVGDYKVTRDGIVHHVRSKTEMKPETNAQNQ
jgi:hypothetical protein